MLAHDSESAFPFVNQVLGNKTCLGTKIGSKLDILLLQHVSRLESSLKKEEITSKSALRC